MHVLFGKYYLLGENIKKYLLLIALETQTPNWLKIVKHKALSVKSVLKCIYLLIFSMLFK